MKTSLGIWAFGGMATRFNQGGYNGPAHAPQHDKDAIRAYELVYTALGA